MAQNPCNLLNKGYAIIEDESGVINTVKRMSDEKEINVFLADGVVKVNLALISRRIYGEKESYEEMLQKLQGVLGELENGELSLEESMKSYEEGVKIVNKLYKTLNTLEGKISIIKEEKEVEFEDGN